MAARFEPQDSESFERLFREYNQKVLSWFLFWGFKRDVADDLTQETFFKVSRYKKNRFIENAAAFLRRRANSARVDWIRKYAEEGRITQSWDAVTDGGEEATVSEDIRQKVVVDPESPMIAEEADALLLKAVEATFEESRSITSDSKMLFIERYIEERDYEEIAAKHGLTVTEARSDFNNTAGKFRTFVRERVDLKNYVIRKTKLSSKR